MRCYINNIKISKGDISMGTNLSFIPKFRKGDLDAAVGVFFDGFSKVLVGVAVLGAIAPEHLFGTILPGLAFTIFVWNIWLTSQAQRVEKKFSSPTTALPGGLQAGRFFIWLFAVMLPTYSVTGDIDIAIKAGIGANLVGSIIFLIFTPVMGKVVNVLPKPAIFAGLAGGSIAFLLLSPMVTGFEHPEVMLASLFVLLIIYFGKFNVKFSASSLAIIIGIIVGWLLGYMKFDGIIESIGTVGFYPPKPAFQFIQGSLKAVLPYLPIVIAFSFTDIISTIQAVEQGRAGGDKYSIKESILMGGVINLIGSLFGNPFPVGYYFGHAAWKRINAGVAHPLISGGMYLVLGITGLIAIASAIIPVAAALPLLVFAAMVTVSQSFEINDKKYYVAMAMGLSIPVYEWAINLVPEPSVGLIALGKGSMLIAILYTYIISTIIDRQFKKGAICFLLSAVLSAFGLMHVASIAFPPTLNNFAITYIVGAAVFFCLDIIVKRGNNKAEGVS